MKQTKAIISAVYLITSVFIPQTSLASSLTCDDVDGMSIFGYDYNEYIYIGSISNEFGSESIANEFGWGNEFRSDSINNEFGTFGNEFGSYSVYNEFTSTPPIIVNSDLEFVGYITANEALEPSIHPDMAKWCAKKTFTTAIDDHEDLTFKKKPSGATSIKYSCPANSTLSGNSCICNKGYLWKENSCISYDQSCHESLGPNSYGDKDFCYCSKGYKMNSTKTQCIQDYENFCGPNSYYSPLLGCKCNTGYEMKNGSCKYSPIVKVVIPTKCITTNPCTCINGYKPIGNSSCVQESAKSSSKTAISKPKKASSASSLPSNTSCLKNGKTKTCQCPGGYKPNRISNQCIRNTK